MGLTITVGDPARSFREEGYDVFAGLTEAINVILVRAGLPLHVEPLDIPEAEILSTGFGWGGLETVTRMAAHLVFYGSPPPPVDWTPREAPGPSEDKAYRALGGLCQDWLDATIEAMLCDRRVPREPRFNQLMSPSTYYVPQDVAPLPVLYGEDGIDGGTVGSTVRLLAECEEVLNHFDLPEGLDPDDEDAWWGLEGSWRAYDTEVICALRLVKACKASIRLGALMVFS